MIIDCVPFFNELDMLELRMHQLDPVVDRFVVVEADRTHAGHPKASALTPQFLHRWREKLVVHSVHLPAGDGPTWTWRREIMQRQAITAALALLDCQPDDMILISDCDEIPRREFVARLPWLPDDGIAIAQMRLSYYTVNHVAPAVVWHGTRATQYGNVQALGADTIRYAGAERGGYPRLFPVPNAGWHLSYFGGAARIQTKIESFLHQEFNHPEHRDPETIAARMRTGADVYGRPFQSFTIDWAIDLPDAMLERPYQWEQFYHPEYTPTFHERWTQPDHSALLARLAMHAPPEGVCAEIGVWEGVSTLAIAHGLAGRPLEAVDTWQGNIDEGVDHPSVLAARERDVYRQFETNVRALGLEAAITPSLCAWQAWADGDNRPLAFLHLDASHDAATVAAQLAAFLPRLQPGGIICGDDFFAPTVRVPVLAAVPDVQSNGRIWYWQKPGE